MSGIRSVATSPDGRVLASAGNDTSARLWRISDGVQLARFNTSYAVGDVAFSPNGTVLATVEDGYENNVRLWNLSTDALIRSFTPQPAGFMSAVAFSPVDGALVTSSGQAHVIHVWDSDTGVLLAMYDRETSWGLWPFEQPLAFTRSGRLAYGRCSTCTHAMPQRSASAARCTSPLTTRCHFVDVDPIRPSMCLMTISHTEAALTTTSFSGEASALAKSSAAVDRPSTTREERAYRAGTSRAAGRPPRAMMISSPASARSTSCESRVLAS